jgi:hypothetical protein
MDAEYKHFGRWEGEGKCDCAEEDLAMFPHVVDCELNDKRLTDE